MIRANLLEVFKGKRIGIETIDYAWPESTLKVTYDIGNGEKTHYIMVRYNDKGVLVYRSKNPIANEAKRWLRYTFGITER